MKIAIKNLEFYTPPPPAWKVSIPYGYDNINLWTVTLDSPAFLLLSQIYNVIVWIFHFHLHPLSIVPISYGNRL